MYQTVWPILNFLFYKETYGDNYLLTYIPSLTGTRIISNNNALMKKRD